MKISCNREALLKACTTAGAAVGAAKGPRPILSNLLAVADGESLRLTGSDIDIGVRVELPGVQVLRRGDAVLAFGLLAQILKECSEPEVLIAVDDKSASVRIGTSRFELQTWPVADYPALPEVEEHGHHEIAAGVLRSLLKRVAFAIGKDTSRFALQGVLWEADGGTVRLVATDSRVLSVVEAPAHFHGPAPDKKASRIVPKRAIDLLGRSLTDDDELVRVYLSNASVSFQTERTTIYTRLLEGRYPPYRDIVGQTKRAAAHTIALPTQSFLGRVRQAAIMAKDETCRVDVAFEPGKAVLKARGADIGSSEVEMVLPEHDGAAVKFSADPEYLSDVFRSFNAAGTASLEMKSGDHPLLFKDGDSHQVILMPMAA